MTIMEPSGHCPYLGLKQNRAIRFASPTQEHRCYVSGEPIDIPVDQSSYCLSPGHVYCPLYTGSILPTTDASEITVPLRTPPVQQGSGIRGWLTTLPPRDRAIYTLMIGMLVLIVAIYLFIGTQSLFGNNTGGTAGVTTVPEPSGQAVADVATAVPPTAAGTATAAPPTPTRLPTSVPTLEPTSAPTDVGLIFPPTQVATVVASTVVPSPSANASTTAQPTGSTSTTTSIPQPSGTPINQTAEVVTLYFGDQTRTLYVPVQRTVNVQDGQVAAAAVRALIAGPKGGLTPVVPPTTVLKELRLDGDTAVVNFDRSPSFGGDRRGYDAVALTLTHIPGINWVQFQVNGKDTGVDGTGPVSRPTLNPINPDGLPDDTKQTEFLPIYFPLNDGARDVRLIRMVPKTRETARATINALLEGPNGYSSAVQQVIPKGTALRAISIEPNSRIITVDFTQQFATAANREAAVRNIVQSLTTLPNVQGVQILVEGRPLADQWGEKYRNGFGKPLINPE